MYNAVGVLGGVGPLATVYFMDMIIEMTDAVKDQEHINMLVSNHATIPDRTAYIMGESDESPLQDMVEDAIMLEKAGCSFIVIPCNTAHYFFEDVKNSVQIPVLNIIEETVRMAIESGEATGEGTSGAPSRVSGEGTGGVGTCAPATGPVKKLGIMATEGTIASGTYSYYGEPMGVECIAPDEEFQQKVNHMIYDQVKAGEKVALDDIMEVIEHLKSKGCDRIIMGCTELSVIYKDLDLANVCPEAVDSLMALARKTVLKYGKKIRYEAME